MKKSYLKLLGIAVLITSMLIQFVPINKVGAAQITVRSLRLIAGSGGDGGSKVGGVVNHEFTFTVPSVGNTNVGSIKFEYCTLAAGTCTMPTGLVTNGGTTALDNEVGATGFTLDKTTNGAPFLTRTASSVTAGTVLSYRLSNITNPTSITAPPTVPNQTFFVRISTYTGIDGVTGAVDSGTVAASTTDTIDLTGAMPESLVFCTGATIGLTSTVPDCATATNGAISFNQLFSPTDTATATSQMAASTNAGAGYNITVNGATLTSGANTISTMSAQLPGSHGVSQFGMNLKLNVTTTAPINFGTEVAAVSNGTNYRGQALTGYATADEFKFVTGDSVANSGNGGLGGSDSQIFTVSYIVNVPGSQPAGTYTTTLTYICTPTF